MNRVTQKRNFICRVGQAQTRPLTRALAKPHTAMKKLRIVILGLARPDSKRSLNDGQIQNPSNPNGIVPLSNFVPRGFGFVHHSIAILYHEVPNLSLTIRNFFIAVPHPQAAWPAHKGGCVPVTTAPPPPPPPFMASDEFLLRQPEGPESRSSDGEEEEEEEEDDADEVTAQLHAERGALQATYQHVRFCRDRF
jgi:hypothetical protein